MIIDSTEEGCYLWSDTLERASNAAGDAARRLGDRLRSCFQLTRFYFYSVVSRSKSSDSFISSDRIQMISTLHIKRQNQ